MGGGETKSGMRMLILLVSIHMRHIYKADTCVFDICDVNKKYK